MVLRPWQPLDGQGVQRISGYNFKNIEIGIRLRTWNDSNLYGRQDRGGREIEEEGGYLWSTKNMMEGPTSSFYWS